MTRPPGRITRTGAVTSTITIAVLLVLAVGIGGGSTLEANSASASNCVIEQTEKDVVVSPGSNAGVLSPHSDDDLLVLLGGFTDTEPTYGPGDFEDAFFGTGTADVNGTGTLRDYYLEATDGLIDLNSGPAGVRGWYETDMSTDQVVDSDGDLDLTPRDNRQFVRKVVDRADDDVDFSAYDNDGDGCVGIVVVYQEIKFRAHAGTAWGDFFTDADFELEADGVTIGAYARVQELHDQTDDRNSIGTPAHEIGHLYGLPDLYEENGSGGIGGWGLMGAGNFGNRSGERGKTSPTHFSAWSKLQLLSHPSVGDDERTEYETVIAPSGRPGILPPVADRPQYYRIEPRDVEGCDACDDQYYLLGYRRQTGFDQGLERWTWSNSLRIWRLDGWNGSMDLQYEMIEGVNRIHGYGNRSFNASTESLALLADGSDSGVDLREFEQQYGVATFNEPPERHLDANDTAVFAVAVATTLPDGTDVGDEWRVDNRVVPAGNAEMGIRLSATSYTADEAGQEFVRASVPQRGLDDGVVEEGAKLVHRTNESTDYLSATTYPTFPLPSDASVSVTDFDMATGAVTIEVGVTAAGEPYEYGEFGAPDADHFEVEIGGVAVSSGDVSVTERAEHEYVLEVPAPVTNAEGYDLSVAFTDEKVGVEHTVTGSDNLMAPRLETMNGTGAAANPYEVTKASHLQAIDADRAGHFELGADVDASETDSWFHGRGFNSVGGAEGTAFRGSFDGNGHAISGLTIDRGDREAVGLFGAIAPGATIRNVTLEGTAVTGGARTGALAGSNSGTVRGVRAEGVDVRGGAETGGLVGVNNGTIRAAAVTGVVTGTGSETGGLVGQNLGSEDGPSIRRSYATADVDGGYSTGGLVGHNAGGLLAEVYATGDVDGGEIVGGLVGYNYDGTVRKSYASGDVDGDRRVAGLVGENQHAAATEGGGVVNESFAVGRVTAADELAAGLVATTTLGEIENSYWDAEATGQERALGSRTEDMLLAADRLETDDMQGAAAADSMSAFDFADTWRTVPDDYPEFQWAVDGAASTDDAGGDETSAVDDSDSGGGDASGDDDDGPDTSMPGFGGGVAVIAVGLFASALLALRRGSA